MHRRARKRRHAAVGSRLEQRAWQRAGAWAGDDGATDRLDAGMAARRRSRARPGGQAGRV